MKSVVSYLETDLKLCKDEIEKLDVDIKNKRSEPKFRSFY